MSVSTLVLLGLAVVWAIVLLPEGLKKLSGVRSGDSIRSFNHQLSSLQRPGSRGHGTASSNVIDMRSRTGQAAPAARPVSPAVRKRRQEVLTVLGATSVLSLLCTVAFGGPFLLLFLVAAGLLVTYVVLLYQASNAPAPAVRTRDGYAVGGSGRPAAGEFGAVGRVTPVSARRIAN
jgi:hypothetical protein